MVVDHLTDTFHGVAAPPDYEKQIPASQATWVWTSTEDGVWRASRRVGGLSSYASLISWMGHTVNSSQLQINAVFGPSCEQGEMSTRLPAGSSDATTLMASARQITDWFSTLVTPSDAITNLQGRSLTGTLAISSYTRSSVLHVTETLCNRLLFKDSPGLPARPAWLR